MKKISIVLLALLLIGGMAFADITLTGTADLALQYDLDTNEFGFVDNQDGDDVAFSFTLESGDASAMGDADVYAVIEMSGSIDVNIGGTDADDSDTVGDDGGLLDELGDEIVSDFSFDTAKIVGENWEVSILGMADDFSYAASYQDYDEDDDNEDDVAGDFGDGGGIAVTYEDYTLGVDFYNGDEDGDPLDATDDGDLDYAVYAATSMEVADGVTVDVAAAFDGAFDAGLKLAYEMDGTAVAVAVDTVDNFTDLDASLSASVDAFSLDAYYGDNLYAQLVAALDPATITLNGDLLLTSQVIGATVEMDATDELALTVDGGYTLTTNATDGTTAGDWDAGVEAVYAMEDFDVTLAGGYTVAAGAGAIDLAAYVESTTLIDGATVYLGWESTDVAGADKGVVAAKVSITL